MPDPYHDLLIFDWATTLESTVLASRLLETPQSTISRRMRSFQADHRLVLRRLGGKLRLQSPPGYIEHYRAVAQLYRLLHGDLRWAAHPLWTDMVVTNANHLGQFINLQAISQNDLDCNDGALAHWFSQRLLDAYLDLSLCDPCEPSNWKLGIQPSVQSAKPYLNTGVQLGVFSGLPGLEDALTARGWTVVTDSDTRASSTLTLIRSQPSELSPAIQALDLGIRPQWRYADNLQNDNPHVESGIRQFENRLAIVLTGCHAGSHQGNAEQQKDTDPLFEFKPLP